MTPMLSTLFVAFVSVSAAAPSDAEAFQRSYDQEAQGDVRGALVTLKSLSGSTQKGYVFFLRKGWLTYLAADHRASIEAYQRAVALAPQAIEPKLGLTLPMMSLRLWQDALGVNNKILRRDPKNYLARSRRAWCLYNLGRHEKAEAAYRDVLTDYPADQNMRAGLAWSLVQQGKSQPARTEILRVLAVAPRHPSALAAKAQLGF